MNKLFNILKSKAGFTLLELLVTLGVLAILPTVVVTTLNPVQMMKQSRDANRTTELNSINRALLIYQAFGATSFGAQNTIYLSLPDSDPQCGSYYGQLPATTSPWVYKCAPSTTYRNTDGTGWIPVDFTPVQSSVGPLFTSLPVDSINTAAGKLYYTYIGSSWALSTAVESDKFLVQAATDGGADPTRFEIGTNLNLNLALGLTILSITPSSGQNTAPVDITDLSGIGFYPGATVKLTKSGETDIVCSDVLYVNSNKLTCTCDIYQKAMGNWNVVVVNPSGQTGTLVNGFSVTGISLHETGGYAWSETIGWVSFNCSNNLSCGTVDYKVNVDADTGLFSGYAWSEAVGWISFNTSDLTGCPSGPCKAWVSGGIYSGTFPKAVTGWAKVLSTNSWMHLSGIAQDSSPYAVELAADGKFSGWSWESDIIGWLSWASTTPFVYNVYVNL